MLDSTKYDWSELYSVAEFNEALLQIPLEDLEFIKHVVVDLKGTWNPVFFELKGYSPHIIKAYFETH